MSKIGSQGGFQELRYVPGQSVGRNPVHLELLERAESLRGMTERTAEYFSKADETNADEDFRPGSVRLVEVVARGVMGESNEKCEFSGIRTSDGTVTAGTSAGANFEDCNRILISSQGKEVFYEGTDWDNACSLVPTRETLSLKNDGSVVYTYQVIDDWVLRG